MLVLVMDVLTEEDSADVLDNVDWVNWFDVVDIVAVDDSLGDVDEPDEDEEDVDEAVSVAEDNVVKFGNEINVEEADEIGPLELEEML